MKGRIFYLTAAALAMIIGVANAQTFSASPEAVIPDNAQPHCFPIEVSGLPNAANSSFGLSRVCMNVSHTWIADLEIWLVSPSGTEVRLFLHYGASNDHLINTCFANNGANGPISQGQAPFTGTFVPNQSLNLANNGTNPNGTWNLCFVDQAGSDEGTLHNFALTFGPNPPPDPAVPVDTVCRMNNIGACRCPDGSQDCDLLPDMTNGASTILSGNQINYGVPEIRVTTSTPNIGYGPLEIRGIGECYCGEEPVSCSVSTCPDGSYPKELITQRVYHKSGNVLTYYDRPAGHMTFHPTHNHLHVDHWVNNTIRLRGPDPDPRTWPILGTGSKVSFCLVNLSDCDASYGSCVSDEGVVLNQADIANRGLGQVTGCGRQQGIYVAKVDIYSMTYDGQQVNLSGLCNGDYYLVSYTDPNDNMLEMNEDNNTVALPFHFNQLPMGNCCQAEFESNITDGYVPFTVEFYDRSTPIPSAWHWDFGDGSTSDEQFPVHTYETPGVYSVTLTITTPTGCTSEITYEDYVVAGFDTVCTAQFSIAGGEGNVPLTVQFTDESFGEGQITSWHWDFGDGQTSNEQNPSHTYTAPGPYSVRLIVVSEYNCRDTVEWVSAVNVTGWDTTCRAMFGATPATGTAPFVANFNDQSTALGNITSWTWDFGDGMGSTLRHPQHIYGAPGAYTVRLTITTQYGCSDTYTMDIVAQGATAECEAAFTAGAHSGPAPFEATFAGVALPAASAWHWDFGDGTTSNEPNPAHTYENPGVYSVTLIVHSENGCVDTVSHTDLISVGPSVSRQAERRSKIQLRSYPNPFKDFTTLEYTVAEPSSISCEVFDALGRRVETFVHGKLHMPGTYRFEFHAPFSGAFLVKTTVNGETFHHKMVGAGE